MQLIAFPFIPPAEISQLKMVGESGQDAQFKSGNYVSGTNRVWPSLLKFLELVSTIIPLLFEQRLLLLLEITSRSMNGNDAFLQRCKSKDTREATNLFTTD